MAIILPSGFVITNNEPVDSRLSVADSASRFSLSVNNVYEGITVYERDTNIIYVLTDATAPSSASSWQSLISNTSSSIATSASYAVTSSYALSGNGSFTGSFTGSFIGDGAGLTNIPASGITGLNLSQIASGSATASISPSSGLRINTDTTITGSLSNGSGNQATGLYSHAEGQYSIADSQAAHAEGNRTVALGFGSHAEGNRTSASANYAHAEGDRTIATGDSSHAEGYFTTATGQRSHAEGHYTSATGLSSHAEGDSTLASGSYSHAEGYQTVSKGQYSHAEGFFTIASGSYSHAEGGTTLSQGAYSHAEGASTIASGSWSHAEGYLTIAIGAYGHAEGSVTLASGQYSHAEGYNSKARGESSHAEGSYGEAIGKWSHAEGDSATAEGQASHAEGQYTIASGSYSHAEGSYTIATGDYAHAEGESTLAEGYASNAAGLGTIAAGAYQYAGGQWNTKGDTTSLFIIGNGTSDAARSDIFRITNTNIQITGSLNAPSITGSLFGTASYALTASYAGAYLPLTGGTISGNLTVLGTASFAYTTASIVQVGSNVIILNTDYPSVRFGGISVIDSGSFGNSSTGSLFWDSFMNRWVYANPSGSAYDGGLLLSGPKNTSGLGNETGMIENFVAVGQSTDHLQPGTIFNSGSITQVTGSLFVTAGVTGSFTGSFTGDGAGLTNIPAAGIVGLNLSQISSGSVSASISPNSGLQINTNVTATSFTGSFSGSGAGLYDIFPVTTNAQILVSTGSVLAARSVTGDIAITNAGVTTIQTGSVTFSKIQTLSQAALIGTTGSLGGVVQEIPIIEAYVPTGSAFTTLLENTSNWDINGVYIGSIITGTYQGQSHLNNDYWFTAVADNNWIRLIRG